MEWHNVMDPGGPELDRLAERYRLHPLHVEDCRHRKQAAKIEDGDGYIFAVLKLVRLDGGNCAEADDLDIFAGPDFVITVLECDSPESRNIIERLHACTPPSARPDQVFYRIFDNVVDGYLPLLDHLDDVIEDLEEKTLSHPSPETLSTIFTSRRSLSVIRRVLVNTRDVAGHLLRTDSPLIGRDMFPFLRDLYDHVARSLDTVEVLRDLLNGSLDVYLSSVANQTNNVMKVLTVLGTIALPALVISGIYGMNIPGLPAADSPHGLTLVFGAMAAATAGLLYLLRRFRWL